MRICSFKRGGMHPPEHKMLSEHREIRGIPLPDTVFIPLNEHLGKPARCLVKSKQLVSAGDRIGEADGYISAHIHSSVSGIVRKIKTLMTASGTRTETVIIDVDKNKTNTDMSRFKDRCNNDKIHLDSNSLREVIINAGIVGMGGATFPTSVKLSPPLGKEIDVLLINGAECEPYLTADHQLMLEQTVGILKGILVVQKILSLGKTYIGIEKNKLDAYEKFQTLLKGGEFPGIQVVPLQVKYPQGGEKQLIQAIVNREVPSGKLPFDVGVIVLNVGTVHAIYNAVFKEMPLIERVTTITGFVKKPGNYRVPIGTSFQHAIKSGAGGIPDESIVREVICGGPMMGKSVRDLSVAVTKGTSGIVVLSESDFHFENEGPCIRCSRCIEVCPMGLMPTCLAQYAKFKIVDKLADTMDCIECGSCSYVCPMQRQLVHWIQMGKSIFYIQAGKLNDGFGDFISPAYQNRQDSVPAYV